jgi:hypothetical protein
MLVGLALSCADSSTLTLYSSNEINLKDVGLVRKLVRDRVGNALSVRQSFENPVVDSRVASDDLDPGSSSDVGFPASDSLRSVFGAGSVMDSDGDSRPDLVDNCPYVPNFLQDDKSGDGIGDVCQCADVDGDGEVTSGDVNLLRNELAGLQPGILEENYSKCGAYPPTGACDLLTLIVMRRALAGLEPTVSQTCRAALPQPSTVVETGELAFLGDVHQWQITLGGAALLRVDVLAHEAASNDFFGNGPNNDHLDSMLYLFTSDGVLLAFNDDSVAGGDDGSVVAMDAYLEEGLAAGEYKLAIVGHGIDEDDAWDGACEACSSTEGGGLYQVTFSTHHGPLEVRRVRDEIMICVVPDTQEYVKHVTCCGCAEGTWGTKACGRWPRWDAMWTYIEANCDAVVWVGDLSASGTDFDDDDDDRIEWERVTAAAVSVMDAGVPLLPVRGNHDSYYRWALSFGDANGDPRPGLPGSAAPADMWEAREWWIGHNDTGCYDNIDMNNDGRDSSGGSSAPHQCDDTMAIRVHLKGVPFLMIGISCNPDPNELAWVEDLITNRFPDDVVIVGTHIGTYPRGSDLGDPGARPDSSWGEVSCSGETMALGYTPNVWSDIIQPHASRILAFFSGHESGAWAQWTDPATEGPAAGGADGVLEAVVDYQSVVAGLGGDGYIGQLRIDPRGKQIAYDVYSAWDGRFDSERAYSSAGFTRWIERTLYAPPDIPDVDVRARWPVAFAGWIPGLSPVPSWDSLYDRREDLGLDPNASILFDGDDVFSNPSTVLHREVTSLNDGKSEFVEYWWFKTTQSGSVGCIAGIQDGTGEEVYGLRLGADGKLYGYIGNRTLVTSETVNDGEWHLAVLAMSFNAVESDDVFLWVDGVLEDSDSQATSEQSPDDFLVGACHDGVGGYQMYFRGQLRNGMFADTGIKRWYLKQSLFNDSNDPNSWSKDLRAMDMRDWRKSRHIKAWWPTGAAGDTPNAIHDICARDSAELCTGGDYDLIRVAP